MFLVWRTEFVMLLVIAANLALSLFILSHFAPLVVPKGHRASPRWSRRIAVAVGIAAIVVLFAWRIDDIERRWNATSVSANESTNSDGDSDVENIVRILRGH